MASHRQRSEALWTEQIAGLPSPDSRAAKPRLWVLAAGLNDQSKAFEGDVEGFTSAIQRINPNAVVLAMNNPHSGGELKRPFGTRENLQRALQTMGTHMAPGDTALVLLSTHGHINILANSAGQRDYPRITGEELNAMLAPLQAYPTGVIVSACYSGSLIPALKSPQRWIMTAAAADRNSFGCNFSSTRTFFVEALLQSLDKKPSSVSSWHQMTEKTVQHMETAAGFTRSSNPQLWVGPQVQERFAKQNLRAFLVPKGAKTEQLSAAD
ncbi:MAG: C13 family peptidase [Rhodoferax sp.]